MGCRGYVGLFCLCLAVMTGIAQGLEVVDELEVKVIENGTVEAVILDCPYTVDEEDLGLVVKWFHAENPLQVYQWIVGELPQALGILADHVDLEYEASEDDSHRHRAIRILNPTTELTGEYTCRVSTFDVDRFVHRKLIVYSRPANVHVWAEEEGEDSVKVICDVEDVFPEPKVTLHMKAKDSNKKMILEGAKEEKTWSEGLYSTKVELIMEEDDLDGPTHFECEVTIPSTDVQVLNKTHYQPRVHEMAGAVISGSESRSAVSVVVSLVFLGLWRF